MREKKNNKLFVRIKDHATLIDSIVIINTNLRYVDWLSGEHFVFISLLKGIILGGKNNKKKATTKNNILILLIMFYRFEIYKSDPIFFLIMYFLNIFSNFDSFLYILYVQYTYFKYF